MGLRRRSPRVLGRGPRNGRRARQQAALRRRSAGGRGRLRWPPGRRGLRMVVARGPFCTDRTESHRLQRRRVPWPAQRRRRFGPGGDFVGGVVPTVPIDGLTIGATMAHRFVEVAWSSSRRSGAVGRRDSRWSSFSWASHPFPPPTFRAWSSPPTAVSFAPSSKLRSRRSWPRSRRPLACFYSSAVSFRLLRRTAAPAGPGGRPWVHRHQPRPLLRRVRLTPRRTWTRPSRARERRAQR